MTNTPKGHIVAGDQKTLSGLKPKLPVQATTSSAITTTLETPETTEMQIDTKDYGRPPENSGIEIITNSRLFSDAPECAENPNHPGEWSYNYPGVLQLAETLGKKLPSEEQLLMYINAIPGDAEAKTRIMTPEGELFPGYRSAVFGRFYDRGSIVCWWVTSSDGSARCVDLERGNRDASSSSTVSRNGYSVRFLSDKK